MMTFTELRNLLMERGVSRKVATLSVRLALGLETPQSLIRTSHDGHMSQKMSAANYKVIEEISTIVKELL